MLRGHTQGRKFPTDTSDPEIPGSMLGKLNFWALLAIFFLVVSLRATWRRSGDKRRARAETGGPVVLIWCVTLCFGGALVGCGCVRRGKSMSSNSNWLAGV